MSDEQSRSEAQIRVDERRACIQRVCGRCAQGRFPRYRDAGRALVAGWWHEVETIPGAIVRCPASSLWQVLPQDEEVEP